MTETELTGALLAMGFDGPHRSAYKGASRFSHPSVTRGSVFVGVGPRVHYKQWANLTGSGAFLIANGRTGGMTPELMSLGVKETGRIGDPDDRTTADDPYWRGEALTRLVSAMKGRFKK